MVSVKNVKKRYGDFRLDVSMELPEGRVTGLVGRNGAGKTTLIKSILGLIRPDAGSVEVLGKDVASLTAEDKRNIGAALSDSGFSGYLRAKDVCAILAKMYPDFDADLFLRRCERQGLAPDKLIKDYSTGMKAKMRVLAAISHGAKLLIMDEPTSGLDVEARNNILDMLREYLSADPERSMLISSHISTDLEGLCDDVYLIHDGRILLHEDTDVILSGYGVLKVDRDAFEKLDRSRILSVREESFGYSCFTNDKQFYLDNCPGIIIENGSLDDLILVMAGGKENARTD